MLPYCQETGIATCVWGPLKAGSLSRPADQNLATSRGESQAKGPFNDPLSDTDKEIIKRVEKISKDKGCTMSQVALAWSFKHATAPIVGISKSERIDEAVGALRVKLTDEEIKHLEEPYKPREVNGHQ